MDNFPDRKSISLCETDRVISVHVSPYKERKWKYDNIHACFRKIARIEYNAVVESLAQWQNNDVP